MSKGVKREISTAEAIRRLAGKGKLVSQVVEVKSVDKGKKTCAVLDEASNVEYPDVVLKSVPSDSTKQLVVFPKVGSTVIIERIEHTDSWFVSKVDEVDEIWLGGNKYSMVKAEVLQTEYAKTKALLDAFFSVLKGWVPPPSPDAGVAATAMFTALSAAVSTFNTGSFNDIKNEEVKHG